MFVSSKTRMLRLAFRGYPSSFIVCPVRFFRFRARLDCMDFDYCIHVKC